MSAKRCDSSPMLITVIGAPARSGTNSSDTGRGMAVPAAPTSIGSRCSYQCATSSSTAWRIGSGTSRRRIAEARHDIDLDARHPTSLTATKAHAEAAALARPYHRAHTLSDRRPPHRPRITHAHLLHLLHRPHGSTTRFDLRPTIELQRPGLRDKRQPQRRLDMQSRRQDQARDQQVFGGTIEAQMGLAPRTPSPAPRQARSSSRGPCVRRSHCCCKRRDRRRGNGRPARCAAREGGHPRSLRARLQQGSPAISRIEFFRSATLPSPSLDGKGYGSRFQMR